ncbi:MAG: zinc-binding dehydrogenase, partial [Bacteroidetes bacterium]|nr:zinc-binding dehydrogenase [Bacteroidota bacterium]
DHLNFEEAAALPLAGLTAFRTLFSRCKLRKGEKVLITGIGGGVALLALQFALKAGAQVFVTSGSGEKIRRAKELGALDGVSYKEPSWDKQLKSLAGGFDVVIDSAGGDGFSALVGLCNAGARIGIYGGTLGKFGPISPQLIFWKQISILGSTMGSPADFDKMLQFVREHKMTPIVDKTYALDAGNQAFKYLEKSEQFGKIVLQH